jgi:hypothetical protein
VRAIALSLEALRKVDRYGVTKSGEQYKGFKALPPASPTIDSDAMTAAEFVCRHASSNGWTGTARSILAHRDEYTKAYRSAAHQTHPDLKNGNAAEFVLLGRAKAVLDRHHQGAAADAE